MPSSSRAAGDALQAIATVGAGVRQRLLLARRGVAEDRFTAVLH